jgi:hypothetical protein
MDTISEPKEALGSGIGFSGKENTSLKNTDTSGVSDADAAQTHVLQISQLP